MADTLEQNKPVPPPAAPAPKPEVPQHRARTYEDDVSRAMNAVDAPVVQEMLATAREREETERFERIGRTQRHWYSFFAIILVILATAGFGYGIYHYTHLTVPLERSVPVGVFRNTAPVVIGETTISELVRGLVADPTTEDGVPLLIPLVTDATSLAPINKQAFYDFIGAKPTEPFAYIMDTVRLGVLNHAGINTTFIVLSVPDAQLASKEFSIAEPVLLQLFAPALGINAETHLAQVGKVFESMHVYNLPVRVLNETDPATNQTRPILLYGYATENVMVIATDPAALKAVSDTIIKQY